MIEKIKQLEEEAVAALKAAGAGEAVEQIRTGILGKKGDLTALLKGMKDVAPEERPRIGALVNEAKTRIEEAIAFRLREITATEEAGAVASSRLDVTLPGRPQSRGRLSPLTLALRDITRIFMSMGFRLEVGPEVETEHYNFDALNFPPDHPSRDMQDTFFTTGGNLLRTHTSPVQIRVMERSKPPVRMICAGWCYRADTLDASHSPMFSQVEGLLVDRRVTMGELFGVLDEFARQFFGYKVRTRYRPSFFPFTEPSAEMDVTCIICDGKGAIGGSTCRVCKGTGWKEILGSGMVDPEVFKSVGYDPELFTGFAFGMGIERLAMFKYGVDEMRHFFEGDLRFIQQF
jgi:phenylalanyl-tRNA synthetase alpha chain